MGLFVTPIYVDGNIDSLHVAVGLPATGTAEEATKSGIVPPVKSPKVAKDISATENSGADVVYFPTVV